MGEKTRLAMTLSVGVLVAISALRYAGAQVEPMPYANIDPSWMFGTPAGMQVPCPSDPAPWCAASADLLLLGRSTAGSRDLMFATVGGTTRNMVNVDDLKFPIRAGIRARAAYGDPLGERLDVAYVGVFDQDAIQTFYLDPAQIAGLTAMGYYFFNTAQTGVFDYTAAYESDLHSVEANWGLGEWWGVRPLLGARWIRQADKLDLYETVISSNGATATLNNDLVGCQCGFDVGLWNRGGWFRTEATAKGGVYHNFMQLDANVHTASGPTQQFQRHLTSTACAGEINVTAIWQCTSCISLRAGYTGLWLAEIGLAPDQMDQFNLATGDGNPDLGGVSYQGLHFGVEVLH